MSEKLSTEPVEEPPGAPGDPGLPQTHTTGERPRVHVPEVHAPELDYGPSWLRRWHARAHANPVTGLITKVVVTLVGSLVIVAGLVMMVAPGPGILAILIGLGILSTEWDWADRWVDRLRAYAHDAAEKARQMDPAVRRRRIAGTALAVVVVAAAVVGYLWVFGWPEAAVDGWDWLQGVSGVVPELPGM